MATLRKLRPICQADGCDNPVARLGRPYCGRRCAGAEHRKRVTVVCNYGPCAKVEERPPSLVPPGVTYCSHEHYVAAMRERERPIYTCIRCGKVRLLPKGARISTRKYCSTTCASADQRTRVTRVCPVCSIEFFAEPKEIASGRGKYCGSACRYEGRRQSCAAEKPCGRAGCDQLIRGNRSQVQKRVYCSALCLYKSDAPSMQPVVCACGCGRERQMRRFRLLEGFGKYYSRACYVRAQGASRSKVRCEHPGCRKLFSVSPSGMDRRFHGWRCYLLAKAPKRFRCPVCKVEKLYPESRRRTFCSPACRNRGRKRERSMIVVTRNRLIIELHAQGVRSPQIAERLRVEDPGWELSPAVIRKVISRET